MRAPLLEQNVVQGSRSWSFVHAASPAAEFSTELFEVFYVARFTRSRLAVSFHYIIQIFNKFQDITPIATRDRLLRQSRRRRQGAWQ